MKKIITLAVYIYVGCCWFVIAECAHLGIDAVFTDWADITKTTDPIGDAEPNVNDIVEVAVANNETNLYFYVRVSDIGGDQFGGDGNEPPYKWEELHFYIDGDDNIGTGKVVGPAGAQIGAEYRMRTTRQADPAGGSGQSELEYWYEPFGEWFSAGYNTKGLGIANPDFIFEGVNEAESNATYAGEFDMFTANAPLSGADYLPWQAGDSFTYTVTALRGSEGSDPNYCDWLDTPQVYTIVAGCGDPNHPYLKGDTNKDCSVDIEDVAKLSEDWIICTDPNEVGCVNLGWY